MPEKQVSVEESRAVMDWIADQRGRAVPDTIGAYVVNGEPLVLTGRFIPIIPWSNLLRLSFRTVTEGRGFLACSDNHAQALTGIISFSETPRQGAKTP